MTGPFTLNDREHFLQASKQFNLNFPRSGLLFIVSGFSFSIIYDGIYLFDSHNTDDNGFASPSRTLVLLKISSLIVVEGHMTIRQVYIVHNNVKFY